MRIALALFAAVLLHAPLRAAVELPPLPEGTSWLVAIDVPRAMASDLGGIVRDLTTRSDIAPKLKAFTVISGIDPLTHITRVVASGVGFRPDSGAVMLIGTFDRQRLTTLVEVAGGHRAIPHGGETIHRWIDNKKHGCEQFGALVGNDRLIFASSLLAVQRAIDASIGAATPATADAIAEANAVPGTPVLVMAATRLDDLAAIDPNAMILRQVRTLTGSIDADAGQLLFTLNAQGSDDQAATSIQQVAQGLLALAALHGSQRLPPELQQILASMQLTRDGQRIELRGSAPLTALRAALQRDPPLDAGVSP